MDAADKILKRMNNNRRRNAWWLKIFLKFKGREWLEKRELTSQAIGVWLNPYTSNDERYRILKAFVKLKSKSV